MNLQVWIPLFGWVHLGVNTGTVNVGVLLKGFGVILQCFGVSL